jgi:hypothetical protein
MKRFSKFIQESIELDEKLKASDDMGDWVKDFQDSDAPQFKGKSQKKRREMAIAAKLSANEEVNLDEAKKDHFVYQKGVPKTKEVVHRGTEQSSKDWIEKNAKHFGHKGKDFDIYKGKYPNVKPSDRLDYRYVAEEIELDEISKSTLGRYATKALNRGDIANRMSKSDDDAMGKIANKRLSGVKKAVDKLADKTGKKALARSIKKDVDTTKASGNAFARGGGVDDQGKSYYKADRNIGKMREEVELDEVQKLFMFKTKAEADKKAKEANGKVISLTKQNFAVVVEEINEKSKLDNKEK